MEAGFQGYGLAMIIGLLAGTLGGAAMGKEVIDFNHDDSSVTNTGQAILAINVAAFGDVAAFQANVDTLWCATSEAARACPAWNGFWCPASAATQRAWRGAATAFRFHRRWRAGSINSPVNSEWPSLHRPSQDASARFHCHSLSSFIAS